MSSLVIEEATQRSAALRFALAARVVIADGAMGTMLQASDATLADFEGHEGCNEVLNVTRPDIIKNIHTAYLAVGADCVTTNTFGANLANLGEYGIGSRIAELSEAGARLAREAADEFTAADGRPRWVLGSIGPGTKLPTLGHVSFRELRDSYYENAAGLLRGGADALIIETCPDLLQAKAAIIGTKRACVALAPQALVIASLTIETTGTMLLGTEIGAALTALEPLGIDMIGLNCATGPAEMSEHLRYLAANSRIPIACEPNAGLPELTADGAYYPLTPAELADAHDRFTSEFGLSLVGGCCGTTPEHIAALVDRLATGDSRSVGDVRDTGNRTGGPSRYSAAYAYVYDADNGTRNDPVVPVQLSSDDRFATGDSSVAEDARETGDRVGSLSRYSAAYAYVYDADDDGTRNGPAVPPHLSSDDRRAAVDSRVAEDVPDAGNRVGVPSQFGAADSLPRPEYRVGRPLAPRSPRPEPGVASLYSHVPFRQDTAFLAIGERTNANGSKAFRDAMIADKYDDCMAIAKSQTRDGAHLLDVCVDYVGRDGVADMREIARRLATAAMLPLVLDSTEPAVIEAGLELIGGRAVVNSVNYEDGDGPDSRMVRLMPVIREHGAAVVALTIDERGQARTAHWKIEVAERLIRDLTVTWGMREADIIVDCLTFPIATGQEETRRDALETIEAIRELKRRHPDVQTTLGVSNVSFGLKPAARAVLNSVFLHECVQAGLDSAIVHPSKIMPLARIPEEQREVALDLVYDRRRPGYDPLSRMLEQFEGVDATSVKAERAAEFAGLPLMERLKRRIIDGERNGLETDLDLALTERPALEIVNDVLLDGMKTVGELFGSGQMQLPFVLQSAEVMKAAVGYLEPHMERSDTSGRGKIVLATVRGDVHDIGKNLVDIILSNNGYDVVNIGIKQPVSAIIAAAEEHNVDVIGMSGLLVKSTVVMRDNLAELNARGLAGRWPVLLGGAALTRAYVEQDLAALFDGEVRYARDAFEGLRLMDAAMAVKRGVPGASLPALRTRRVKPRTAVDAPGLAPALDADALAPASAALAPAPGANINDNVNILPSSASASGSPGSAAPPTTPEISGNLGIRAESTTRSSDISVTNPIPEPPFWGTRIVKGLALAEYAAYLDERATFMGQWGLKPSRKPGGPSYEDLVETEGRPRLRMWLERAQTEGLLQAAVVYGYFRCVSDGSDLIVLSEDGAELERFTFPRQQRDQRLCLADYFRPRASGETDVIAFQLATMGSALSDATAKLFAADAYREYLELHGLSVQLTEALAEYWHARVRSELSIDASDPADLDGFFSVKYQGARYSIGYPACPDLADRAKIARLLRPERIGVELSEEMQLHPEQSTDAIVVHHPAARYFSV